MKKGMALLMSVLALGLVAMGCGGDDDEEEAEAPAPTTQPAPPETETAEETAPPAAEELNLTADETEIAWDKDELTAPAGEVTIALDNPSQIPHNVTIEGVGDGASETVTNDTTEVTVELEAGEYTYFCSVGDHRQQGMEGTLTVE
jgi:plastocyanin